MNRPTSVLIFGILNLAFGALGIVGVVMGLVVLFMPIQNMTGNIMAELIAQPGYRTFVIVSSITGSFLTLALIAGGIGLLLMKRWGWLLSIAYGGLALIQCLVGMVVVTVFFYLPLIRRVSEVSGPEQVGMIGGIVGGLAGMLFGLLYPIVLLIFMLRAPIRAAFAKPADA